MTSKVDIKFDGDTSNLEQAIAKGEEAMKRLPEIVKKATLQIDKDMNVAFKGFSLAIKEADNAGKDFALTMINLRDAGSAFTIIASRMDRYIQEAIDSFVKFDKVVQQTASLATESGKDVSLALRKDIVEAARDVAIRFNQDIGSTALSLRELVAMGYSATDAIKILEAGSLAAVSGLGSVDRTTALLANTLRSFSMDVEDSASVAAIFTSIANSTSLTMDEMATAMQFAGAQAGQMGFSLEETVALLGLMKSAGLEASIAGTTLRQFLVRIQDPTSESRQKLEELGITLTDNLGNFLSMSEIMANVQSAIRGMTEEQRAQVIATLFETRGQAAFNLTMAQGLDTLTKLTKEARQYHDVTTANAYLTEKSSQMLDSSAIAYERAKREIEITSQIMGEKLIPMETRLLSLQNAMTRGFIDMPFGIGTANAALLQMGSIVLGNAGNFFIFVTSIETAFKSINKTLPVVKNFFMSLRHGAVLTDDMTKKVKLLKFSVVGLSAAYLGLITFTQALNAQNETERVLFSVMTGLTWALAAATVALAVAKQLALPIAGVVLAVATIGTYLTSVAAANAVSHGQFGAFVKAKPGRGELFEVGEGVENEVIAPEPMLRRIIREEVWGKKMENELKSSDTFIFNIPPSLRITDREARNMGEIVADVKRRSIRRMG